MKTCKMCKWWEKVKLTNVTGFCTNDKLYIRVLTTEMEPDGLFAYFDADDYYDDPMKLETCEGFGCIHWAPKP